MTSPFGKQFEFKDVDRGAASHKMVQVRPVGGWSGDDTTLPPSQVNFQYKAGRNMWIKPNECYLAIRCRLTQADGTALNEVDQDTLGLARFAGSMLWGQAVTTMAGNNLDNVTQVADSVVYMQYATKSKAWLDTFGEAYLGQAEFAARQAITQTRAAADTVPRPEILAFIPTTGFWEMNEMVRSPDFQLELTLHSDFAKRAVENSATSAAAPGAANEYRLFLDGIELWLSTYSSDPSIPLDDVYAYNINNIHVQTASLASKTSGSEVFNLSMGTPYRAFVSFRDSDQGSDANLNKPLSKRANASVTDVAIEFGAQGRLPQIPYNAINFTTGAKLHRPYKDFVEATNAVARYVDSGASLDYNEWKGLAPTTTAALDPGAVIYGWTLVTAPDESVDSLSVESTHSSAYSGVLSLCTVHQKILIVKHGADGQIEFSSIVNSKAEAMRVLKSM